jgi:hypothetical protein
MTVRVLLHPSCTSHRYLDTSATVLSSEIDVSSAGEIVLLPYDL